MPVVWLQVAQNVGARLDGTCGLAQAHPGPAQQVMVS